ncbi:hypothetical protein [Laspinema olomoucense]|uniref:Uncharacterized protein n=1 Tax=Laspinema olomoucense D3b TaxID=2953688 RepID=A0ABT2N855_9CYAN|nr:MULTISPECIES: hypothetical protein [unclassified Laspinema]MCT7975751.1 hypothetical protein [Laspinema sp. D3d]MCT7978877.1 hypothetical protein [Laspinema sp. D3b]MCT7988429.1 hypothetical protein [Laspinema sp. D3a]MCT7996472.1 hypothetical protein [Laspinema sp. D3c]
MKILQKSQRTVELTVTPSSSGGVASQDAIPSGFYSNAYGIRVAMR